MDQQVLDEFEDYWTLLPTKDPEVYFEIQSYLKNPGGETNVARIFKKSTITYLETNLYHFPYPVCQVLNCFPSPISGQIIYDTLLRFCKAPDALSEKKWKLYNFLANIHLVDKWMDKFEQTILPIIYETINRNYFCVNNATDDSIAGAAAESVIDDYEFAEIALALLSNRSWRLLRAYVDYEKHFVVASNVFTQKAAYVMAVDKKIHFLEHLFIDEFNEKIPIKSRHCVNLVKTIMAISNGVNKTKENFQEISENFNHRIISARLKSNQMIIYDEIQRIFQLYGFLRSNVRSNFENKAIPIRTFSGKYNIIDYLYEHLEGGVVMTGDDYETIRNLLVENEAINLRVNSAIANEDGTPSELDLFDQYYVLHLFFEALTNSQVAKNENAVAAKCQELKIILVGIQSVQGFVEALEAIYTMLFLRWEHVHGRNGSVTKIDASSSLTTLNESDTSEDYDDDVFLSAKRAANLNTVLERIGFVCSYELLKNMLSMLDESRREKMKLQIFQAIANDDLKQRFDRVSHEIKNAKWRLSLFEPFYSTEERAKLSSDLKRMLTPFYEELFTHARSSSDDDAEDRSRYKVPALPAATVTRRKPRRKHLFKKYDHDKSLSFLNSTEIERKQLEVGSSSSRATSVNDRRSIISRMLGPPVNLVAVCMSKGNMREAKAIIQENSLETNNLARELKFYESFNATKNELKDILPKPMADRTSKSIIDSDISVEMIKTIAAHGFESSQVSNLMQAFMDKNKVEQSSDTRQLLERYSSNYPFLKLYVDGSLQGTTVVDYILSLSTNYDICYNLFNILPKLWDQSEPIDALEDQLGFYGSMKKIISSLNLYNAATNQNYGVQYLISNGCFSFQPNEMSLKLKQTETYERLRDFDANTLSTIEILKENISQFDVFNKRDGNLLSYVFCYAINMNRLINFKNIKLKSIAHTSPKAILEIDLFSLIGEIIFGNHANAIIPDDIEAIVCNLNTNLLHVLSMNTCPVIGVCRKFGEEPNEILNEILDTIENDKWDFSSFDESQPVPKVKKIYKIQSKDLLNYVGRHNDLIAYLMGEIHGIKFVGIEKEEPFDFNYSFIKNTLDMKETKIRYELYDNNPMVTALNFDYFDVFGVRRLLKSRKIFAVLQIIQYCKETDWKKYYTNLSKLQDHLIQRLLDEIDNKSSLTVSYQIIENIRDIQTKTRVLLRNIDKIRDDLLVKRLIRAVLLHNRIAEVTQTQKSQLEKYLADIEIYAKISDVLAHHSTQTIDWIFIMKTSNDTPEWILKSLIKYGEFDLCYQWIQVHPLGLNKSINAEILESIFKSVSKTHSRQNDDLFKIIEAVPKQLIIDFDSTILLRLKNRQLLEYLVDYLTKSSIVENENYRNYKISLKILEAVPEDEANTLWSIVNNPMLIIEQYIMNSKFESLTCMLKAIRPLITNLRKCKICSEKRNELFSGRSNSDPNFNSKLYLHANCNSNSELTLSRFDYNYSNHYISIECIESLLRVYAAKALDFRISETQSTSDVLSQTTEMASLDSLCGTFAMPRETPEKSRWVRDEEASHCMCCKRAVFTMLTRRHHCRRCGRVVCHSCSTKRMNIPNIYADVLVRVCDDCYRQTEQMNSTRSLQVTEGTPSNSLPAFPIIVPRTVDDCGWFFRFSGHFKHDQLLREEFCYEYAPSVSLCLSILSFHTSGLECATFLLHHCRKFESLLRPIQPGQANPEVDYTFVTRILYCLSLAVKVHGGSPECAKIREHAEIINSVVRNGCEALLPMEELNTSSLRKLRDSLVVAEKWSLAVELSLKCGFPKTGIMAAWGIACLKAGCFETGREKFSYCLNRTACEEDKRLVIDLLTIDDHALKTTKKKFTFKNLVRPPKIQPLLQEIVSVLEVTCHPVNLDVLHKASVIRHSNRSLTSIKLRKKENLPVHEPAINVLHTLANLKKVSHGKYAITHDGFMNFILPTSSVSATTVPITPPPTSSANVSQSPADVEKIHPASRFYSECIFYLVTYGRHSDILEFLVKHKQITKALYYTMLLKIPSEQFIQTMILPFLKIGKLSIIIGCMIEMDETLVTWKEYIIQTCRLLEKKKLFNSLYQLQLMLQDTVRASMTCVRFYTMKCSNYQELRNNSFHLMNAQKHLNSELELCQWEEIKVQSKNKQEDNLSLAMKMDPKSLNQHINTIWRQIEAAKFLAKCEENGRQTIKIIPKISMFPCTRIPTLFGTTQDKIIITALVLICGTNIEEGFGLAYRIIQEMSLNADKIYAIVTKYVSLNNRVHDVEKLIECVRSNSTQAEKRLCDEILSLAVQSALNTHNSQQVKSTIENLIRMIDDIGTQIDCHLLSGQLKAAYLLAVHHKRITDIRRILRHAEKTNQPQIKKLCEKKLMAMEDVNASGKKN